MLRIFDSARREYRLYPHVLVGGERFALRADIARVLGRKNRRGPVRGGRVGHAWVDLPTLEDFHSNPVENKNITRYRWTGNAFRGGLDIGCRAFTGVNARALKVWALRRRGGAR